MFRAVRGGRFEKVESGLRALMARRGTARPAVGFAVTILRRTVDHLDGIIALYDSLALDGGITFQLLQRRDAYTRVYDATLRADHLDAAGLAGVRQQLAGDERLARIQRERLRVGFYDELFAGELRACPWLSRGAFVNIDGQVTGCCTIKDATLHSLGAIGSSPASAFSDGRERLAASLARGEIPAACAQCDIAERLVR
jgi:MoaA/NifB/PqqE/SkfB family radical SAM enzyme